MDTMIKIRGCFQILLVVSLAVVIILQDSTHQRLEVILPRDTRQLEEVILPRDTHQLEEVILHKATHQLVEGILLKATHHKAIPLLDTTQVHLLHTTQGMVE